MAKRLVDHTDEELLAELLRRNKPSSAPNGATKDLIATVDIGKDDHADILICKDSVEQLEKIVGRRPL